MLFPYQSQFRRCWEDHFPANTQASITTSTAWCPLQRVQAWSALVLTSLIVLLPNLAYPLIEPDETRYAQIALEMNDSRDWITPTLDGQPYLDKPPLMYWLTALSFEVFGRDETSARLPSMLAALSTILLTFGWGSRIVGRRAAWLAAMSLALCGGFVLAGRFLILDSLLALFTTSCMLSGYIAVREKRHRRGWWMVSGVACALGVMTKGPVALVLCVPPLILSGWLRADHSRTRFIHWVAFFVPMIVICVPWYVAVARYNPQFVDYFFWEHNFQRFTQGSNHEQPFWFYVPVVFAAMFPTSLLLPSLGVFLASRSNHHRSLRSKDVGFLFCGAVWMLAFFSAASCKLPTYILPAIPLLTLLAGVMLDHTVVRPGASDRLATYLRKFPQRANLILIVSCSALIGVDIWIAGKASTSSLIAAIICIGVTVLTLWSWNCQAAFGRPAWAATSALATGVLLFASSVLLPTISSKRSMLVETSRVADANPNACIVFFYEKPHAALFHLPAKRTTYFSSEMEDEFADFVSRQSEFVLVTDDQRIEQTRQMLAETHELTVSPHHEHVYRAKRITFPFVSVAGRIEVNR